MKADQIIKEIGSRIAYLEAKEEEYKYKEMVVEGANRAKHYAELKQEAQQELGRLYKLRRALA